LFEFASITDTFFREGQKRDQFGINDTALLDTTRVAIADSTQN
jgi:hypothetical protein